MAKIIIIGAGVAGLAAGICAQADGHQATVFERHFRAGGNLTGWDRNGYHIALIGDFSDKSDRIYHKS